MFYPTVKEYKPIRYKGYDIFLELKLNNMMIANCLHDDDNNSFTDRFMDYSKQDVVNILKDKIKNRKDQ
jgi:hypothetical protein